MPLTPLTPARGWGKIYFGGLLLMDHSDHHRFKYVCEALDFKYHLGYPWGVPLTPYPLDPYIYAYTYREVRGGLNGGGQFKGSDPRET